MSAKTIGSSTAANNTGGAAADYFDLDSWEAAETGADATGTIITKAAAVQTTQFVASASGHTFLVTADATCSVVDPTAAELTSKARIVAAVSGPAGVVKITGSGWTFEKIAVVQTTSYWGYCFEFTASATVQRCGVTGTGTYFDGFNASAGNPTVTLSNCFALAVTNAGVYAGSGGVDAYHLSMNIASGSSWGVGAQGGTANSYAVAIQGATPALGAFAQIGGTIGGDYNVSPDSTAPGSHSLHSASGLFTNTTGGSEDLSLAAPLPMVDERSLSAPADCATGIEGTTRPAWSDPGCWQSSCAGPLLDAVSESGWDTSSSSSISWSHTCTGSDLVLLVGVVTNSSSTISGVTYNGVSLTKVGASTNGNSQVEVWRLVAPATGTHTVAVSFSATSNRQLGIAASYTNVDQTTPVDVHGQDTQTTATQLSVTQTTTKANARAVMFCGCGGGSLVRESGSLVRLNDTGSFISAGMADMNDVVASAGSSTVVEDWIGVGGGNAEAMYAVWLAPPSSGGNVYEATGSGGATTTGSAARALVLPRTASGGGASSGAAARTCVFPRAAAGGAIAAGAADRTLVLARTGSGGAVAGGAGTVAGVVQASGSGGASAGGSAARSLVLPRTAAGDAVASGGATPQLVRQRTGSGGASTGGAASRTLVAVRYGSGGAAASGAASRMLVLTYVGAGGATASGAAEAHAGQLPLVQFFGRSNVVERRSPSVRERRRIDAIERGGRSVW